MDKDKNRSTPKKKRRKYGESMREGEGYSQFIWSSSSSPIWSTPAAVSSTSS